MSKRQIRRRKNSSRCCTDRKTISFSPFFCYVQMPSAALFHARYSQSLIREQLKTDIEMAFCIAFFFLLLNAMFAFAVLSIASDCVLPFCIFLPLYPLSELSYRRTHQLAAPAAAWIVATERPTLLPKLNYCH